MTAQLPITAEAQRAKLTARDFWTLADAGAFDGLAKSELIEGEVWVVNAVHAWHAKATAYISIELGIALRQLGSDLVVYTSGSVDLTDDSVPEPDVSVGQDHDDKAIPLSKLRLAIEVTDTTRANDLTRKRGLYARAGVAEYWVIDREKRCVVQKWSPTQDGYAREHVSTFGEELASGTISGLAIATAGP